jgi:hypothetical protein
MVDGDLPEGYSLGLRVPGEVREVAAIYSDGGPSLAVPTGRRLGSP